MDILCNAKIFKIFNFGKAHHTCIYKDDTPLTCNDSYNNLHSYKKLNYSLNPFLLLI